MNILLEITVKTGKEADEKIDVDYRVSVSGGVAGGLVFFLLGTVKTTEGKPGINTKDRTPDP